MAKCPRCARSVDPYTRCDGCGLMLGFDGLTVLIDFENSPAFERARALARRQSSYSEWSEENGHRYLHVTYSKAKVAEYNRLAAAAATLSRKHTFLNGMEIPWPSGGAARHSSEPRHPAARKPRRKKNTHASSSKRV